MVQSVPINTGFKKYLFSFKIIRIRDSQQNFRRKRKKEEGEKRCQEEKSNQNLSVSTVSNFIRLKVQK